MRTKLILFTLLVIILASCSSEARMKSKIKKAVIEKLSQKDKDVKVEVTNMGEVYAWRWEEGVTNDSKSDIAIKEKLGTTKYRRLQEKTAKILVSGVMSKGNLHEIKSEVIDLDKTIKECGAKPANWFTTCTVVLTNKVYKQRVELVCGVTYTENEGENVVDIIPDLGSAKETDL